MDKILTANSSDFVNSLAKGLAVIKSFGPQSPRMTLTEVAEKANMTRPSARRFLLTLTQLGYAYHDGKYFELTPKTLELGYHYLSSLPFWEKAQYYADSLKDQLRETCTIAVLNHNTVASIVRAAEENRVMTISMDLRSRLPVHATSFGQVMLAAMNEEVLEAKLEGLELEAYTPRTLITKEALRARLSEVRTQGYAYVDQEHEVGLRSIAVPLVNEAGECIAAMAICTNVLRVSRGRVLNDYLPALQATVDRMQRDITFPAAVA
ncbi:MAG: IclR family transcriptional regulator [Kordiimonas sp.]|nr:IclR family transcriptional regulator [Kordiimonas sp.]